MYYIKENNKITFADDNLERLKNTLLFKPGLTEADIQETEEGYTVYNFELMTNSEKEAKVEEEEQDRINHLTMSKLDLVTVLKSLGVTSAQIKEYLANNEDASDAFDYCQNVYCGVVRQYLPITVGDITITDEQIVAAFKAKNEVS